MQEIVPVDFRRAFCPLEGGGGGQTYWHQAYTVNKYLFCISVIGRARRNLQTFLAISAQNFGKNLWNSAELF